MNTLESISKSLKIASCALNVMRVLDVVKKLTACILVAASACTAYHIASACMTKRLEE